MTRKWKQPTLFTLPLAKHIVLVKTSDIDIASLEGGRILFQRMRVVSLDKSILLDFHVGHKRGDPLISEVHSEWLRLTALLNSRVRGKRFDFFGDSMIAQMFRKSIREKLWMPNVSHYLNVLSENE